MVLKLKGGNEIEGCRGCATGEGRDISPKCGKLSGAKMIEVVSRESFVPKDETSGARRDASRSSRRCKGLLYSTANRSEVIQGYSPSDDSEKKRKRGSL